jgi:hypothetical protein
MWIVAIGWSYVVILMAATETSFVAGVMTFLVYCMIPLSVLLYITGGKRRRARRAAQAAALAGAAEDETKLPAPHLGVAKNTHIAGGAGVAPASYDGTKRGA